MINKVILLGYLGKDPEMKILPNGDKVVNVSLATNKKYKNDAGNVIDKTEWHNLVAWRNIAEIFSNYLKKGSRVYVEGELKTDQYEKEGVKCYATKIMVNLVKMLDKASESNHSQRTAEIVDGPPILSDDKSNDDLPF